MEYSDDLLQKGRQKALHFILFVTLTCIYCIICTYDDDDVEHMMMIFMMMLGIWW